MSRHRSHVATLRRSPTSETPSRNPPVNAARAMVNFPVTSGRALTIAPKTSPRAYFVTQRDHPTAYFPTRPREGAATAGRTTHAVLHAAGIRGATKLECRRVAGLEGSR